MVATARSDEVEKILYRNPVCHSQGFTLIELLVTVTVLCILAIVATPAYNRYVLRGKLAESFAMLGDYRLKLEQFNQDNRNYADAAGTACGIAPPGTGKYFDFSCAVSASGTRYTASASSKANAGMGNAGDYSYTINQDGLQNTVMFAGSAGPSGSWQNK